MPTDYSDEESLQCYIESLGKMSSLIAESDVTKIIVAGDFNCRMDSRFYDIFLDFVSGNKFVWGGCKRVTGNRGTTLQGWKTRD